MRYVMANIKAVIAISLQKNYSKRRDIASTYEFERVVSFDLWQAFWKEIVMLSK